MLVREMGKEKNHGGVVLHHGRAAWVFPCSRNAGGMTRKSPSVPPPIKPAMPVQLCWSAHTETQIKQAMPVQLCWWALLAHDVDGSAAEANRKGAVSVCFVYSARREL